MDVLHLATGHGHAKLRQPREQEAPIAPEDPATRVMTDFASQPAVTVMEHVSIDEALQLMKAAGVRALVVMRDEYVAGLITSYDIQGERAFRFQQSASHMRHQDVEVGDIMTPWEQVPVIDWREVTRMHVREVVVAFRGYAGTHLVVVERSRDGEMTVRGVISRTRIAHLLGGVR
jgi:CBS domain-containing protein